MRVLSRAVKLIASAAVQLLYSLGLMLLSLAITGSLVTLVTVVLGMFGCELGVPAWKAWLFSALPLWLTFECYVNVRVWRILHNDKKRREKLREIKL